MPISLRNPPAVRPLTADESDRLERLHGTSLAASPVRQPDACITCGGKGKFTWWDDPHIKDFTVEYECRCIDQWLLHRFLLNAGIDRAYQQLGWGDLDWADPGHIEVVRYYLERATSYVSKGFGYLLWGTPGTGKTALAVLALKSLLVYGYDGYFTTFNDMVSMFTAGWRDLDEQAWFHQRVKNTTVLVIDDPGRDPKGGSEMRTSLIDEVLRHRVAGLRPTFVTTNLTLDQFRQKYGEYVMSLLSERTTTHEFAGTDVRITGLIGKRLHDEDEQGLSRPMVMC